MHARPSRGGDPSPPPPPSLRDCTQPKIPDTTRVLLRDLEDAGKAARLERDKKLWDAKMLATQTQSACSTRTC